MHESMSRVLRVVAMVLSIVGAIDAVRGAHWDQATMLSVIAIFLLVDLGLDWLRPTTVAIRADHLDWLREEAARTDDAVGLVAGRAIAAYRSTRASPAARGHDR